MRFPILLLCRLAACGGLFRRRTTPESSSEEQSRSDSSRAGSEEDRRSPSPRLDATRGDRLASHCGRSSRTSNVQFCGASPRPREAAGSTRRLPSCSEQPLPFHPHAHLRPRSGRASWRSPAATRSWRFHGHGVVDGRRHLARSDQTWRSTSGSIPSRSKPVSRRSDGPQKVDYDVTVATA